jgi:hypothetical protein
MASCPQYIELHGYCTLSAGHDGDCQLAATNDAERQRLMFNAAREGYLRGMEYSRRDVAGFEEASAAAEHFAREYCDARSSSEETP